RYRDREVDDGADPGPEPGRAEEPHRDPRQLFAPGDRVGPAVPVADLAVPAVGLAVPAVVPGALAVVHAVLVVDPAVPKGNGSHRISFDLA
ncbi:MAG: hypothetical protein ACXVC1_00460, partial [Tumebacillaceae bacterium]